jgi:hypothetical protein
VKVFFEPPVLSLPGGIHIRWGVAVAADRQRTASCVYLLACCSLLPATWFCTPAAVGMESQLRWTAEKHTCAHTDWLPLVHRAWSAAGSAPPAAWCSRPRMSMSVCAWARAAAAHSLCSHGADRRMPRVGGCGCW